MSKTAMAFFRRGHKIQEALAALANHEEEFYRLLEDERAYVDRCNALFAEERFRKLWFTAADVRRAFESTGRLSNCIPKDQVVEKLRAGILFLADKDRRLQLATELLLELPYYISAGRHLDGWVIDECANITLEQDEETNPFLFQMFRHGYEAWEEEERAFDERMLREFGLDPARLPKMSTQEVEAWVAEQEADPAKSARMEAMIQRNPKHRAVVDARMVQMEKDSIKLLEGEDASRLFLRAEEIERWVPIFTARLEKCPEISGGRPCDEAGRKAVAEAVGPVMGEMAQAIFTRERIEELRAQLTRIREERFAARDTEAVGYAVGALSLLCREDEPGRNFFLNILCFASLERFICDLGSGEGEEGPDGKRGETR